MNDKQPILELMTPKAVLKAMNSASRDSIPYSLLVQDMVGINHFPFKVGRESRFREIDGKLVRMERTKFGDFKANNDLYLTDACQPMHISREHFLIERNGLGYTLIDRSSACGVTVGATTIGGQDSGGKIDLKDGDIIAVGAKATPYTFKFIVLESLSPSD